MAKAKKKEAPEIPSANQPEIAAAKPLPPSEPAEEQPSAAGPKKGLSAMKTVAVAVLFVIVIGLAYYFLSSSDSRFIPSSGVDAETFKGIFAAATKVYIVMDVRGASNDKASTNVLQCGVDFAASSGMGGKTVTPMSLSNDGCIAPDGKKDPKQCFSMLKDGITIYVTEGTSGTKYYSNGMVVTVGQDYVVGTCGIRQTL